jgi:hypothetical protein
LESSGRVVSFDRRCCSGGLRLSFTKPSFARVHKIGHQGTQQGSISVTLSPFFMNTTLLLCFSAVEAPLKSFLSPGLRDCPVNSRSRTSGLKQDSISIRQNLREESRVCKNAYNFSRQSRALQGDWERVSGVCFDLRAPKRAVLTCSSEKYTSKEFDELCFEFGKSNTTIAWPKLLTMFRNRAG